MTMTIDRIVVGVALTRDLADLIDRYGYVVRDDGRLLKMEPFQCL